MKTEGIWAPRVWAPSAPYCPLWRRTVLITREGTQSQSCRAAGPGAQAPGLWDVVCKCSCKRTGWAWRAAGQAVWLRAEMSQRWDLTPIPQSLHPSDSGLVLLPPLHPEQRSHPVK